MAKIGGTQVNVGIGIEGYATPGVSVAETYFFPWADLSMQSVSAKVPFTSVRGLRNMSSNSMIQRRYSKGSLSFIPNVKSMPYALAMALGGVSSSTVTDSAYTHTFTVNNNNATPRTATISIEQGGIATESYLNCVCDALNIDVSDSYAKCSMTLIGGFTTSDTLTESYTNETEFAYHQMTVKFGTSLSNASGNAATPLRSFKLNINNNVLIDEAFLSGANTITAGNLVNGRLEITGSYSLAFENTTELAKYQANTKNAMIVTFTGALIGASSLETVQFKIGRAVLTAEPLEYNSDGLVIINQEFTVEYEATDLELQAIVINNVNNASTRVYDKA